MSTAKKRKVAKAISTKKKGAKRRSRRSSEPPTREPSAVIAPFNGVEVRYVRITCRPVDGEQPGLVQDLMLDAIIDAQGNICGRHALFGLWGEINYDLDHYSPFVFRGNGTGSFDDLWEREAQTFSFDLRNGPIVLDRRLSFRNVDGTFAYRITEIIELPFKG